MSEQAKSPKKISKKKNEHATITLVSNQKYRFKKYGYISWYYLSIAAYFCILTSNAYALADELARASDGMITPLWSWINAITPTCTAIGAISGGLFASGDLATRGKGAITGAIAFAGAAEFIKLLLVG